MRSARESSSLSFRQLQRWFLEQIVAPHRRAGGPDAPLVEARSVAEVILPSATLSADQRMHIYVDQYIWRLQGIMGNEHSTIKRVIGDQAFDELAIDYLSRFPPNDTLSDLCHALPYYLEYHCDRDDAPLLLDIARIERAISDAYDTYPVGRVTSEDLSQVSADAWPLLRFRMEPSVHILSFGHDVIAAYNAGKAGEPIPKLKPKPTWGAVWRHEHQVWRHSISQTRYEILSSLAAGETVTLALERATEVWDGTEEALAQTIFQWFAEWVREGMFASLIVPSPADLIAG